MGVGACKSVTNMRGGIERALMGRAENGGEDLSGLRAVRAAVAAADLL
jgi:hypothetical protein